MISGSHQATQSKFAKSKNNIKIVQKQEPIIQERHEREAEKGSARGGAEDPNKPINLG